MMMSKTVFLIVATLAVVAIGVHSRLRRGRRLLVVRDRPTPMRWVLNGVFLVFAAIGFLAPSKRNTDLGYFIGPLGLLLLTLSDIGFDFAGGSRPGYCAFHQNGIQVTDGRRWRFSRWDEIERYEWQGDTLMIHLVPLGLAHVGEVRAVDVPPERRAEVLAVIAPRLRG